MCIRDRVYRNEPITEILVITSGGGPNYTYSLSGRLPNGPQPGGNSIADDPIRIGVESGVISGTPIEAGRFPITVTVKDSDADTASRDLIMNVNAPPPLSILTIQSKTALLDSAITPIYVRANGGVRPYTFSISGAPSGISIGDASGRISGIPTTSGRSYIAVTARDADGQFETAICTMDVYDIELAEMFSPILILTSNPQKIGRKVIFPEPVEIMGADSAVNIWFAFYGASGNDIVLDIPLPQVRSKTNLIENIERWYPGINFDQNEFALLPGSESFRDGSLIFPPYGVLTWFRTHFEYPGNHEAQWYDAYENKGSYDQKYAGVNHDHTAYVHFFRLNDGRVLIQYYYFYPFNDFQNNHEGDWQHINVVASSYDPSIAQIESVVFKFHGKAMRYDERGGRTFHPRQGQFATAEGGQHPVVYVGAGSHGGYPTGGKYKNPDDLKDKFVHDEIMSKFGYLLSTSITARNLHNAAGYNLVFLPTPDSYQPNMGLSPEMSWLGTRAKWGTYKVPSPGDLYNRSPVGPFYSGWETAGTTSYDRNNVPIEYADFQQFPIVQNVSWSGTVDLIGDIVVYPCATLTIKPGTVVRVFPAQDIHEMHDSSRVDIVNYGKIIAVASKGDSIVFGSSRSTPKSGDWYGIRNYGSLRLENCVIRDALDGLIVSNADSVELMELTFSNNQTTVGINGIADIDAVKDVAISPGTVTATGGTSPYTYSLFSVEPTGIDIDSSTGIISGTPTAEDTSTLTVAARDSLGRTGTRSFTMRVRSSSTVQPPPGQTLTIGTISNVTATVGVAMTAIQVTASGGRTPYTYSLESKPSWMSISSSGRITGTPTSAGVSTVKAKVTDADSGAAKRSFTVTVELECPTISVSAPFLLGGCTGKPISTGQVTVSGGQSPYTYSLTGAPSGISISSSGVISGTSTQIGSYLNVGVNVTDSSGCPGSGSLHILIVSSDITIKGISDKEATQNSPISNIQVGTSSGCPPYSYSLSGQPSGISISTSGVISGTPTATGSFNITVTVSDADSTNSDTESFTLRVTASLSIASISDVAASKGVSISPIQVSADGGQTPYTYSLSSNPSSGSGLSISSSGSITGTPSAVGNFTISVTVTDDNSKSASRSFTMRVTEPLLIGPINDQFGEVGVSIDPISVNVYGGVPSYTYSMSGAPSGLEISQTGEISGTPTEGGDFYVTVNVTDHHGRTASGLFSLTIFTWDYNNDGRSDASDAALFKEKIGLSSSDSGFDVRMDLNRDGTINFADFFILSRHIERDASSQRENKAGSGTE